MDWQLLRLPKLDLNPGRSARLILLGSLLLFTACDSDKSGKSSGDSGIFDGTANAAVPSGVGVCAVSARVDDDWWWLTCWSASEWVCLKYMTLEGAGAAWFNHITCDQLCVQAQSATSATGQLECRGARPENWPDW